MARPINPYSPRVRVRIDRLHLGRMRSVPPAGSWHDQSEPASVRSPILIVILPTTSITTFGIGPDMRRARRKRRGLVVMIGPGDG